MQKSGEKWAQEGAGKVKAEQDRRLEELVSDMLPLPQPPPLTDEMDLGYDRSSVKRLRKKKLIWPVRR